MRSRYTIRRTIRAGGIERVAVDNGTFNDNFLVKRWYMFPSNGVADSWAVLSTEDKPLNLQVSDNRQFGWATFKSDREGLLDPDHIIVQDFFIHNITGSYDIEVIIELERVKNSDAEAALYMIKERGQGPLE